jgi:hypothetical protein
MKTGSQTRGKMRWRGIKVEGCKVVRVGQGGRRTLCKRIEVQEGGVEGQMFWGHRGVRGQMRMGTEL